MRMSTYAVLLLAAILLAGLFAAARSQDSRPAGDPGAAATSRSSVRKIEGQELATLLKRLAKEFGQVRTLQAEFVQEKHLSLFKDVAETRGVFLFQQPRSVRFEIRQPFRSIVLADGKHAAKYEQVEGNWRRLDIQEAEVLLIVMNQISSWILGEFGKNTDLYDIRATQDGCISVILLPRPKAMSKIISEIDLQLDETSTRFKSIVVREPQGDYSIMKFVSEVRNAALDKNLFDTSSKVPLEYKYPTTAASGPAKAGETRSSD